MGIEGVEDRERGGGGQGDRWGVGGKGAGDWGRGGGDNVNYLVQLITENKTFHFLLRDWMFLSASDVSDTDFLLTSLVVGNLSFFFSLSFFLCLSLSSLYLFLSVTLVEPVYISEESNYNYL